MPFLTELFLARMFYLLTVAVVFTLYYGLMIILRRNVK